MITKLLKVYIRDLCILLHVMTSKIGMQRQYHVPCTVLSPGERMVSKHRCGFMEQETRGGKAIHGKRMH
jgi:hypothetical protein